MSEVTRYGFTVSEDHVGAQQAENGAFVLHEDYAVLQQKLEQAEGDAQVGLQLSERLARQLGEVQEALDSEKRLSSMYKKMRGTAVAGHAKDLDRLDAVAEELGKLAGAMLNRTLDTGSKQAVAYADCADMVAKFAATLRAKGGE